MRQPFRPFKMLSQLLLKKGDSGKGKIVENFTPLSGFIGGLLIGLSAVLLILLNGKIAGISGIVGGLLARKGSQVGWRAVFIAGLLLGAFIFVTHRTTSALSRPSGSPCTRNSGAPTGTKSPIIGTISSTHPALLAAPTRPS